MTISATDIVVPVCSKIPLLYLLTQKVAQKFGYVLGIGKRQGSICHDDKWRIDPSSYPDVCLVDNMAVWWFRATCFHGLKYLCVNREVLKQNYIMRTEMKASNECLYPTDVFLVSCGMGCKRITVSDIAYIEAMKDNCVIHMIDGKCYTQSCPMGDIEPELNPNMFKRIHRSFIVNIRYIDMYYYGYVVLENGMEVHIGDKYREELKSSFHFWGSRNRNK